MNSELKTAFGEAYVQDVLDLFNHRGAELNRLLSDRLYRWLHSKARKRATAADGRTFTVEDFDSFALKAETDLGERLAQARLELEQLAAVLSVRVVNGGRVDVTAPGSHEQVLNKLAYGSTWHDGHPDLTEFIVSILSQSS